MYTDPQVLQVFNNQWFTEVVMLVKSSLPRGKAGSTASRSQENRIGRLTFYTTPEKEFAVRYLALTRRKSVSKLLNEELDVLFKKVGLDPATLPKTQAS
jgi:hypothetical protein